MALSPAGTSTLPGAESPPFNTPGCQGTRAGVETAGVVSSPTPPRAGKEGKNPENAA